MAFDLQEYTILLIEDNAGDCLLIQDYLEDNISRLNLITKESFQVALATLKNDSIQLDVILLDLSLPDKRGEELLISIINLAKNTPIIVLTGYTNFEFGLNSLSLGISDYLLKDEITASSLYKSIIYSIERKRITSQLLESESRYSNLFRLSPEPMLVYCLESHGIKQANEAALNSFELDEETLQKVSIFDLISKEEHIHLNTEINRFINDEIISTTKRYNFQLANNEFLLVDTYSSVIELAGKKFGLMIAIDVTDKVLFENKLTKSIIQAQEEERIEIGSELHDNICQILASSNIRLSMLSEFVDSKGLEFYNQSKGMINLALQEIRNLSHRLAPVFYELSSFEELIDNLLNDFNFNESVTISLKIDDEINYKNLQKDLQLNLFRILQEQLRNIYNYAHANNLSIEVAINESQLMLIITDDGIGFDPKTVRKGIGLANIQRRVEMFAGTFNMNASPGKGCKLEISIPLIFDQQKLPD
ncbi:MAG: response regulator [Fluviicola sp.]|nr:response regulator [Fluviicola sp.]